MTIQKFLSLFAFLVVLNSCSSQKLGNTQYHQLCESFLQNLYDKKYDTLVSSMDDIVIKAAGDVNLDTAFALLSNKLRQDYNGKMVSTFISAERTFHENLPSTFLLYKIESNDKFGYYFFYINENSNKILLVSEFSRIKQKRK